MHEMYVLRTTRNRFCPWAIKFTSRDLFHLLLGIIYCYRLSRILINLTYFYVQHNGKNVSRLNQVCLIFFYFTKNGQVVRSNFFKVTLETKGTTKRQIVLLLWSTYLHLICNIIYGRINLFTLQLNHLLYNLFHYILSSQNVETSGKISNFIINYT